MPDKKKSYNPLFEPIPGNDLNLHTGLEQEDVVKGKTSERIHKEVFGELSDEHLMNDIFGISKKQHFEDVTLSEQKKRQPKRRKPIWEK